MKRDNECINRVLCNGCLSFYERKEIYFLSENKVRYRKKWYYKNYEKYKLKVKIRILIKRLIRLKLPFHLSFLRWCLVDFLRGKERKFKGIYQFIGMPGEGKTISMVAHIERVAEKNKDVVIATNFNYKYEDYQIRHWVDIININLECVKNHQKCLIAIDEIQNTFDASDFRNFPAALYTLLTFNRKNQLQFLCSAQIYERIPSKIRDLSNYTVICKNVIGADRWFINYYFEKQDYESTFEGKRKKAKFVRQFIADDNLYLTYNTLEQIAQIKGKAEKEKDLRERAFDLLFGSDSADM